MRRAGGDVGGDVVVGVDEPVRGGGLVDREPGEGLARVGAEVVCDHVLGLDAASSMKYAFPMVSKLTLLVTRR